MSPRVSLMVGGYTDLCSDRCAAHRPSSTRSPSLIAEALIVWIRSTVYISLLPSLERSRSRLHAQSAKPGWVQRKPSQKHVQWRGNDTAVFLVAVTFTSHHLVEIYSKGISHLLVRSANAKEREMRYFCSFAVFLLIKQNKNKCCVRSEESHTRGTLPFFNQKYNNRKQ